MKNRYLNNKSDLSQLFDRTFFFSLGYGIWIISQLLPRLLVFQNLSPMLLLMGRFIGLLITCITIFYKKDDQFRFRQIYLAIFCGVVILFCNVYIGHSTRYIDLLILILMSINIDFKRFIRNVVVMLCIYYGFSCLLAELHVIPSYISYREGFIRDSLGFVWSTWPVHGLLYVTAGILIVRNYKVKIFELLVLEGINIFLYYKTNTRSPFILITLLLCTGFLIKNFKIDFRNTKIFKIGNATILPFLFLAVYFLSNNASSFVRLNDLLSGRLYLGKNALIRYGVDILGQPIQYITTRQIIGSTYDYIDSSYLNYLLNFGIISTVIFILCWISLQIKVFQASNQFIWVSIFFVVLNGFLDPQFIEPYSNYFIVLIGLLLSEKKIQEDFFVKKN